MKLFGIFRKKKEVKPEVKPENKKKKIPLDKDTDLTVVEKFDEDKYLADTFEEVFRAIRYDNWKREFTTYGEMYFTKGLVKLKINFYEFRNFQIRSIDLSTGYQEFKYTDDLDELHYKFFHEVYCDFRKEENEVNKKKVDMSMKEIRDVLGKETLRDSKIDMLLNSDGE
jgi:hypothetical protein